MSEITALAWIAIAAWVCFMAYLTVRTYLDIRATLAEIRKLRTTRPEWPMSPRYVFCVGCARDVPMGHSCNYTSTVPARDVDHERTMQARAEAAKRKHEADRIAKWGI